MKQAAEMSQYNNKQSRCTRQVVHGHVLTEQFLHVDLGTSSMCSLISFNHDHVFFNTELHNQGRVVRKPVNANPGLKVNRGNNFSCIKVLSFTYILYVLCSLRLLVVKIEGQKI